MRRDGFFLSFFGICVRGVGRMAWVESKQQGIPTGANIGMVGSEEVKTTRYAFCSQCI